MRSEQIPDELLDAGTILVAQLETPLGETEKLVRRMRRCGGRCLLNSAPALALDPVLLRELDLLVANEGELAATTTDPAKLARGLRQALVVTRGAAGAVAYFADGARLEVPALAISPVDTTGAGDTFVGVLAAALDRGADLEFALRRAGVAAGLACLAHGAQSEMTLRDYAAPIRRLPVDKITTDDVLSILKPVWNEKPETASRLRGRVERVLDAAKAQGLRSGENPAR